MKRWLIGIAIFLLAGAVVNLAVAWGCVSWSPVALFGLFGVDDYIDTLEVTATSFEREFRYIGRGFGYTETTMQRVFATKDNDNWEFSWEGYPWPLVL